MFVNNDDQERRADEIRKQMAEICGAMPKLPTIIGPANKA
jgi:hypothetical protein